LFEITAFHRRFWPHALADTLFWAKLRCPRNPFWAHRSGAYVRCWANFCGLLLRWTSCLLSCQRLWNLQCTVLCRSAPQTEEARKKSGSFGSQILRRAKSAVGKRSKPTEMSVPGGSIALARQLSLTQTKSDGSSHAPADAE